MAKLLYPKNPDGGITLTGPTVLSRNDPAFKAYSDSLNIYNETNKIFSRVKREEEAGRGNVYIVPFDKKERMVRGDNPGFGYWNGKMDPINTVTDHNGTPLMPLFKKPVAPPVLAKAGSIAPKGIGLMNTTNPLLLQRPVSNPKVFMPKTDHNFYFGNAQSWNDDNREIGYYNMGDGEGRQKITMKELNDMDPDSRKRFLDSFGRDYHSQYEQAYAGMKK